MPLAHRIDSQAGCVTVVGSGVLSMPAMIEAIERVADDPLFRPEFTVVFDMREIDYAAELTDGDKLADLLRSKQDRFRNRFAVVVADSLLFLARLYCTLAAVAGFDRIRCFTDIEEARRWCAAAPRSS